MRDVSNSVRSRSAGWLLTALLLMPPAGCGGDGPEDGGEGTENPTADLDQDGFTPQGGDCDDNDASTHPGASEVCDGKDNDCDGETDENGDLDGDGYLSAENCEGGEDCNDGNAEIYPGAPEICDGKDNNCDGAIDENFDDDGDGEASADRCASGTDCDDSDPEIYSGATESCDEKDNDCDGSVDENFDNDGDGYTSCSTPVADCNDSDPSINPGAVEVLDDKDNDCQGGPEETEYDSAFADQLLQPATGYTLTNRATAMAGDLNGDGCDDAILGLPTQPGNPQGYRGSAFILMGADEGGACRGTPLDNADFLLTGIDGGEGAGGATTYAGDLNGDGYDDVVVTGSRRSSGVVPNVGAIYIIFGKASGWSDGQALDTADVEILGTYGGEEFGSDVAGVGDVNGDGLDDLLIGASSTLATQQGNRLGRAYLLLGRQSGWEGLTLGTDLDAWWTGPQTNSAMGSYMGGAGDINADGYMDMLVGAPATSDGGANSGNTYLILGGSGGWVQGASITTSNDGKFTGQSGDGAVLGSGEITRTPSATGVGDVDGDGYHDFVITAPNSGGQSQSDVNSGKAYLVYGQAAAFPSMVTLSTSAGAIFYGDDANHQLGTDVAPLGDVNRDGFDDFMISAPGKTQGSSSGSSGYVHVLTGRADRSEWQSQGLFFTELAFLAGQSGRTSVGESLPGRGDFNGDGLLDFSIATYDGALMVVTDLAY